VNRNEALALLDKHSATDASWRAHCLQVGAAARHLAELIAQRAHPVDVDRAEVLGLLHDLGRSQEHSLRHGIEGYHLAWAEGHQDLGRICLLHLLKGRTLEEGAALGILTDEERTQLEGKDLDPQFLCLEEKIAILADAMMSDTGLAAIEEKYANARRRYGDEVWVKKLAEEISQLLGQSPYDALRDLPDDLL
jgi:HD superfamily phosphodiesterase